MGELGVVSWANRKPTYDFPVPLNTNFYSICRRLAAIPMSGFDAPVRPPILGG